MKKSIVILASILSIFNFCTAQKQAASPAETATGKINGATITIKYGSPSVKGREIWGQLVPFDKVWRESRLVCRVAWSFSSFFFTLLGNRGMGQRPMQQADRAA